MNNDLISRSALMEIIKQLAKDVASENGCVDHVTYALKAAFDIAKEAPAVDAVEVVRCKDCRTSAIDAYSNRRMCIKNGEIRPNGRIWFGTAVNDDHFCAYGAKIDTEVDE